ncbi:MAG: outer membrane beta-barrel protein [Myxococcales bacterium]
MERAFMTRRIVSVVFGVGVALPALVARAQVPDAAPAVGSSAAPAPSASAPKPEVTVAGYAEAYYSYNFNQPSNGLTAQRWKDDLHNTFTLATAVLDVTGKMGPVLTRIALQAGPTADGWYAEDRRGLNNDTWKHIQQAYASYTAPIGNGLTVSAGLFLTPVGFETAAVKDNWNWSRSNMFLYLPFYHAGVQASYPVSDKLTVNAMVWNGWNSAVDANNGKTGGLQALYTIADKLSASVHYMGGDERPTGDTVHGSASTRHLLDAWVKVAVTPKVSLAAHGNVGLEFNRIGTQSWQGAAVYARFQPKDWFAFAVRGDAVWEAPPTKDGVTATAIVAPTKSIYSGTATLEFKPVSNLSARLEYRHDTASSALYFSAPALDANGAWVADQRSQDTLTLGLTTWFDVPLR